LPDSTVVDVHGVCAQDITRDDSKGNNCGFFRIRRGTNEAGIEAEVVAGVVAKSSDASCSASCKRGISKRHIATATQADNNGQCHITSLAPSNPCEGDGVVAGIHVQFVDTQDNKRYFSGQFDMSGPATASGIHLPPGYYAVRHAAAAADGALRARSHCRFVPPLIHFTPDSLTYLVPLFLKRQCDRTLGALLSPYVDDGAVNIACAKGTAPQYDACAVRQGTASTRCVNGVCVENPNGEAKCTCFSPYGGDRSDRLGSCSFIPPAFVLRVPANHSTMAVHM
jgi:hypothetical protein